MRRLVIRPGAIGDFIVSLPALVSLAADSLEVWTAARTVPDRKSVVEGKSVDIGVTGVQTCALPISCHTSRSHRGLHCLAPGARVSGRRFTRSLDRGAHGSRSEERRGGKECRYWRDWSSDVCSSDLLSYVPEPSGTSLSRSRRSSVWPPIHSKSGPRRARFPWCDLPTGCARFARLGWICSASLSRPRG